MRGIHAASVISILSYHVECRTQTGAHNNEPQRYKESPFLACRLLNLYLLHC